MSSVCLESLPAAVPETADYAASEGTALQLEPYQTDPDNELVSRVQSGDLEAFGELVTLHSRRVYRTLMTIVGEPDAQDAMQDTFLKALEHIGDFKRRSRFSTWVVSIAVNTGVQRLRERRRYDYRDDPIETAHLPPQDANPEQLYSQAERRRLVADGLMKVPHKYRIVLMLRDIQQMSAEEAATLLGLRLPALKARLFRARLMLRRALSPYLAAEVSIRR